MIEVQGPFRLPIRWFALSVCSVLSGLPAPAAYLGDLATIWREGVLPAGRDGAHAQGTD